MDADLPQEQEQEQEQEQDVFDQYVASTSGYATRYFPQLIKWLPPFVGFSIFLAYFFANHFYPSFDLFQFSSLLMSAALIGFCFVGLLTAGVAAPGLVTIHYFVNNKSIRTRLRHVGTTEQEKTRNANWLIALCFVLPHAINSLASSSILLGFGSSGTRASLVAPAVVSLVFGVMVQEKFKLPKWSFLRYLCSAYLALLIVNLVVFTAISQSESAFGGLLNGKLKAIGFVLVPFALSIIISLFCMAAFGGVNYLLCVSIPLALAIAFYSGALTAMPERVMKGLGLGNYEASEIALESSYCEKNPPRALSLDESCSLKDIQVVWSLGETLVLRLPGEIQVQVPSRHVKAILRGRN